MFLYLPVLCCCLACLLVTVLCATGCKCTISIELVSLHMTENMANVGMWENIDVSSSVGRKYVHKIELCDFMSND
jgi:hypothetical protein